jgi:hypothetical protein
MHSLVSREPDCMDNFYEIGNEMADLRFRLSFVAREIVELKKLEL